jgi:HEPN domain-containing protein
MKTPEQVKWDFVQQWLAKANQDLSVAQLLLKDQFEGNEAVGFHAQQAVEKFMKAFLVRHQIEFPKTHNISVLKELIAKVDQKLSQQFVPMEVLTAYGVEYRYPGVYDPVSQTQGKEALSLAEQARDLILSKLETYLKAGRPEGNK